VFEQFFANFVDFRRANDPRLLFVDLPGGFANPKNPEKKLAKFFFLFFTVSIFFLIIVATTRFYKPIYPLK